MDGLLAGAEGELSLQFTCPGDTDREVVHARLVCRTARAAEVPTLVVLCTGGSYAGGYWHMAYGKTQDWREEKNRPQRGLAVCIRRDGKLLT